MLSNLYCENGCDFYFDTAHVKMDAIYTFIPHTSENSLISFLNWSKETVTSQQTAKKTGVRQAALNKFRAGKAISITLVCRRLQWRHFVY